MPLYEALMPVRYALPLLDIIREDAVEQLPTILDMAGVSLSDVQAPGLQLSMSQFDALMSAATDHLGRSDIGFRLGQRIGIHSHSQLGQVLAQCRTLDELLRLAQRYWRLITPSLTAHYARGSTHSEWRVRVSAPMGTSTLQHILEAVAVSCHLDVMRLVGSDAAMTVHLSIAAPRHRHEYGKLTPTRFQFSSGPLPEVRCVLPTAVMDRPLSIAATDPGVPALSALDRAILEIKPARRYVEWLSLMLREADGVQPTRAELAAMLDVSERSLTRHLADEGVTFRSLSNRIRHERACAMLDTPGMTNDLIALRLGYSDAPNFIRAFKTYSGLTPAQARSRPAQPIS